MFKELFFRKKKVEAIQLFQNISIEFKNGKIITASIPAFVSSEEELKSWEIETIKITEPKELPDGCRFSD